MEESIEYIGKVPTALCGCFPNCLHVLHLLKLTQVDSGFLHQRYYFLS